MKKKKSQQVVFKPYTMGKLQLPTDLEDLIPENHLVRVVHDAIEKMGFSPLLKRYKGGGTSSYHPKMMLMVGGVSPRSSNQLQNSSKYEVIMTLQSFHIDPEISC